MFEMDGTMRDLQFLSSAEIQQESLRLLLEFSAFCSENGLRCSLAYGTLLGAVRHKGFIPWDDDIDVFMPRPDYNRLISMEKLLPEGKLLLTSENSGFALPFAKFATNSIRAQEPACNRAFQEYLWIDVFPIDGARESKGEIEIKKRDVQHAMRCSACQEYGAAPSDSLIKKGIKIAARPVLKAIDAKKRMRALVDGLSVECEYESAENITCYVDPYRAWILPKAGFEAVEYVGFEGHRLPAMGCWDEFLTLVYGDYMQLPPVSERRHHQIRAWRV